MNWMGGGVRRTRDQDSSRINERKQKQFFLQQRQRQQSWQSPPNHLSSDIPSLCFPLAPPQPPIGVAGEGENHSQRQAVADEQAHWRATSSSTPMLGTGSQPEIIDGHRILEPLSSRNARGVSKTPRRKSLDFNKLERIANYCQRTAPNVVSIAKTQVTCDAKQNLKPQPKKRKMKQKNDFSDTRQAYRRDNEDHHYLRQYQTILAQENVPVERLGRQCETKDAPVDFKSTHSLLGDDFIDIPPANQLKQTSKYNNFPLGETQAKDDSFHNLPNISRPTFLDHLIVHFPFENQKISPTSNFEPMFQGQDVQENPCTWESPVHDPVLTTIDNDLDPVFCENKFIDPIQLDTQKSRTCLGDCFAPPLSMEVDDFNEIDRLDDCELDQHVRLTSTPSCVFFSNDENDVLELSHTDRHLDSISDFSGSISYCSSAGISSPYEQEIVYFEDD